MTFTPGFAVSVSTSIVRLHDMILDEIDDKVMVSFDPNYRKEVLDLESYRERCQRIYESCNLFLPSEGEAVIFEPEAEDDGEACRSAAGALCVQRKGLMESAPVRSEVEELVWTKRQDGTGGQDE